MHNVFAMLKMTTMIHFDDDDDIHDAINKDNIKYYLETLYLPD